NQRETFGELVARRGGGGEGLVDRRGEDGQVAHLAPWPRGVFPVQVQGEAGGGEDLLAAGDAGAGADVGAEQVRHARRRKLQRLRQRKVADRPQLQLELRRRTRLPGVVSRVVRAGRHLVDVQAVLGVYEQLHREQPDHVQPFDERLAHRLRLARDLRGDTRGGEGEVEDAVAVDVLTDREGGDLAARRAGAEHRDLHAEGDPPFEDQL